MSKISLNNLSDNLKDHLNNLGMKEEEFIIKETETNKW